MKQWVSEARDELKGVAILWILFFHGMFQCGGALAEIQKIGYGGVDIFFFLTGFGLYHSLRKNNDLAAYASRRLWRLLPAYLPVLLCWMLVMYPTYKLPNVDLIRSICGNLFMVGYWINTAKVYNWYVNSLFFFLLIAPVVFAMLSGSKRPLRTLLCLLAICFGIGLTNIARDTYMGASRLPIFVLGMAFAMDWRPVRRRWLVVAGAIAALVLGLAILLLCMHRYPELLNDYAMYWHPFVLITPPLCVGLAWLFHRARRVERLFAPLRMIGQSSFEIYLLNIWMVELCKKYAVSGNLRWALLCVGNVALGVLYHWAVKRFTPSLQRACARVAGRGDA